MLNKLNKLSRKYDFTYVIDSPLAVDNTTDECELIITFRAFTVNCNLWSQGLNGFNIKSHCVSSDDIIALGTMIKAFNEEWRA